MTEVMAPGLPAVSALAFFVLACAGTPDATDVSPTLPEGWLEFHGLQYDPKAVPGTSGGIVREDTLSDRPIEAITWQGFPVPESFSVPPEFCPEFASAARRALQPGGAGTSLPEMEISGRRFCQFETEPQPHGQPERYLFAMDSEILIYMHVRFHDPTDKSQVDRALRSLELGF